MRAYLGSATLLALCLSFSMGAHLRPSTVSTFDLVFFMRTDGISFTLFAAVLESVMRAEVGSSTLPALCLSSLMDANLGSSTILALGLLFPMGATPLAFDTIFHSCLLWGRGVAILCTLLLNNRSAAWVESLYDLMLRNGSIAWQRIVCVLLLNNRSVAWGRFCCTAFNHPFETLFSVVTKQS